MTNTLESRLSIRNNTNNTVSDYFHLNTDLLFEETKSGKALASLIAPSPTPLILTDD